MPSLQTARRIANAKTNNAKTLGQIYKENRQLINDHGDFIHNVLAGKGDEIVKNMPVISLKSDDFGKIIRMLTDDVDKYQAAINMANEMRVM